MSFLSETLEYFLPSACAVCRTVIGKAQLLCESCDSQIKTIEQIVCKSCGDIQVNQQIDSFVCRDCLQFKPSFEICRSVFELKEPFSHLLFAFKFKENEAVLDYFAHALSHQLALMSFEADCIIPVPLHWFKLLRRGYNQAAKLALVLSKTTSIPVALTALKRVRLGREQKQLNKEQRLKSIKNAFQIKSSLSASLKNKRVLLVDDVYTTGATAMECSKVLQQAGAKVAVLTLARTVLQIK